jgi:hypothetical protein
MTISEMLRLHDRNRHQFGTTLAEDQERWERRLKELRARHEAFNQEALAHARAEVVAAVQAATDTADGADSGDSLPTDLDN